MQLNNLHCIDLDMAAMQGFRKFVSCWLYHSDELTFVVDPGPLSTMPHLLAELRGQQVTRLDYILLTHIHIDHAGGTGALVKEFPAAQVICHQQGIKHMVEPQNLWLGTQKVLGGLAEVYGEILPVPRTTITAAETLAAGRIKVFLTPGHAQHHCCYLFDELLFGGEIVGVHAAVAKGIYLRPATPPRFILEVAVDSIQRMIALQPRYLVIAHYGLVEPAVQYLQLGRKQLQLWVRGVAELLEKNKTIVEAEVFAWLQKNDENYRNLSQLADDIRSRERYFLGNSIRGIGEYVESLAAEDRQKLLQP